MRVVIMGLGNYKEGSGISAAKFFISQGDDILITDLKNRAELVPQIKELKRFCKQNNKPLPKFVLREHRESDILAADMVVRNPGVPGDSKFLALAKTKKIPIETDVSIFMKNSSAKIIGVTGTRGKSTTASLIYEILCDANASHCTRMPRKTRIWLGGNIKVSPLSFISKVKKSDIVVLELSSWLLENFDEKKMAPYIAVVTNIYQDHLNTYKNMAEYVAAKKNIFARQKTGDFLVVNGENKETKKWRGPGKTIYFYKKDAVKYKTNLLGGHNLENISAALVVAKICKVSEANIKKVLENWRGLPDRQELIARQGGVKYINDTTATSPDGVIAALRAFGEKRKNIVLICGGKDKNLEYDEMAREMKKYCKIVILLPGSATEKIKPMLHATCYMLHEAKDMMGAVNMARQSAVKGDIVLLSPGAASFGLFKNEFDRGEQFKKEIKGLLPNIISTAKS